VFFKLCYSAALGNAEDAHLSCAQAESGELRDERLFQLDPIAFAVLLWRCQQLTREPSRPPLSDRSVSEVAAN
jgi:hypothetical protein